MQPSTTSASQRVMIVNRKGLHARASARLSRLAGEAVTALAALIAEGFGEQGPDDVVC